MGVNYKVPSFRNFIYKTKSSETNISHLKTALSKKSKKKNTTKNLLYSLHQRDMKYQLKSIKTIIINHRRIKNVFTLNL